MIDAGEGMGRKDDGLIQRLASAGTAPEDLGILTRQGQALPIEQAHHPGGGIQTFDDDDLAPVRQVGYEEALAISPLQGQPDGGELSG